MNRSDVLLRQESTGLYVSAHLIERIDWATAKRAEQSWHSYVEESTAQASSELRPEPLLEHGHWKWAEKVRVTERMLSYPTLAIECDNEVQGLMLLETDRHFGRLPGQIASPLVYVNLLATAPWNLPQIAASSRYRGVGTVLMAAAVTMSIELGFKGRIALHSLSRSEDWYERLGMEGLGPDPAKQSLKYYEMTPAQAARLLL